MGRACPAAGVFHPGSHFRYLAPVSATLRVHEIYLSIQGESTYAGLPCVFIRLSGCNLRCSYCDTAYAFVGGRRMSVSEILAVVEQLAAPYAGRRDPQDGRLPLVELTGGEPLLQAHAPTLLAALCDAGFTTLIETSGALDISRVDPRARRIMDLKCPSSGECEKNLWSNLDALKPTDEIKFVITTWEDYAWMKSVIERHNLSAVCPLLVSWAHPLSAEQQDPSLKPLPREHKPLTRRELVEALVADAVPARFQAQLHKLIWPPEQRGV
jgi:7-carboxy-7-deazaguanine synthase